jgi:hypothetical protein
VSIGRVGQAMAAEADRRAATGEPLVRYHAGRDRGWSWMCPVQTCLMYLTEFETERAARWSWQAHADLTHPGMATVWPDTSGIVLPKIRAGTREASEPEWDQATLF